MARVKTISLKEGQEDLWHAFMKIAEREGRSASSIIAELIDEYVKKHRNGNPVAPLTKWLENPDYNAFPTLGDPADWSKLARMPQNMLSILHINAKHYVMLSERLLEYAKEHKQHLSAKVLDSSCPYCCPGDL